MLTSIQIDNYKCFSNFTLQPKQVNLLVGVNGSGKTSLMRVLQGIKETLSGGHVPDLFPTSTLSRWTKKDRQTFTVTVKSDQLGVFIYELTVLHDLERKLPGLDKESLTLNGKPLFGFSKRTVQLYNDSSQPGPAIPFGISRSFISEIQDRPESRSVRWFRDWWQQARFLHPDPSRIRTDSEKETATLTHAADNFADWYRHLVQSKPEALETLLRNLKPALPGFSSLKLEVAGLTRQLVVAFVTDNQRWTARFDELSDGQRMLVLLYALLEDTSGQLQALDEPDNFVATSEIQPWLSEMRSRTVAASGQLFVISHNSESMDYLAADGAFIFSSRNGIAQCRDLNDIDLKGAKLSDALTASGLIS
jgi:predicted ATPase